MAVIPENDARPPEAKRAKWLPFLCIIAASALAHLWCLGSQFYMDDIPQIRDSQMVASGNLAGSGLNLWTILWYVIQYRFFGPSPVAFHAFNWILHTAAACVLFGFGRDLVEGKHRLGIAWFAALLFAVHPLASEIPNYARAQDMAWLTLFSLLAGWCLLKFLRGSGWLAFGGCLLFGLAATFSKGPGVMHAGMVCAIIGLAYVPSQRWVILRKQLKWIVPGFVIVISALWLSGKLGFVSGIAAKWSDPRFMGHAYTISRVFWEFAWRGIIPIDLSSDHQIAETLVPAGSRFWNIPDKVAMLSAVSLLALTAGGIYFSTRKSTRLLGVCAFVFASTMLFRVLYPIQEFMPEYRIYPGMPWFCLGAAVVLSAIWHWLFNSVSPRVFAVILLLGFAGLSAKRSFLWHDVSKLVGDVLKQYPTQGRAVWELHDQDLVRENWQAIVDRQEQVWPEVRRKFILESQRLAPARELPTGHFALAEVACAGRAARAQAHLKGPQAGLQAMGNLELYMKMLQLDPVAHSRQWGYFYHDKGLILEMAGDYAAAAECLRLQGDPPFWPEDRERVEKKLAEMSKGAAPK